MDRTRNNLDKLYGTNSFITFNTCACTFYNHLDIKVLMLAFSVLVMPGNVHS